MRLSPVQLLLAGYGTLIAAGTALLSLPAAVTGPERLSLTQALFTATSAVCVTGLTVVNTARDLSTFGQAVVLTLIQFGAIGLMTMATLIALIAGRHVSLRERLLLREDLKSNYLSGLVRLVLHVVALTATFELVGAAVLYALLAPEMGPGTAAWFAAFHSVSAFANAGFDIFGDSLVRFQKSPGVVLTVAVLLISGGLGFSVLLELLRFPRTRRVGLHTHLVLLVTLALLAGGTLLVLAFESRNPNGLAGLPGRARLLNAFFTSATSRTAGFNTLSTPDLTDATLLLLMVLMFIGASPGSTGGGIKTTTAAVLLAAVVSASRGSPDTVVFGRRLPLRTLSRALVIVTLSAGLVATATLILLALEGKGLRMTLFEVVSAFATVGLSTGLSEQLSPAGRLVLVAVMFTGRVGPVTIAFAIGDRWKADERIRFPEESVAVG